MFSLIPTMLVTLIYVGFRVYATRDRRLSRGLILEALAFAICSHIVMYIYRIYWLREGMSTFGKVCPNGFVEKPDPANSLQTTCVATGQKTYPVVVGFNQIPENPTK
jgi:hypothetical protein